MASSNLPVGTVIDAPAGVDLPDFATRHPNLASESLGAQVLSCLLGRILRQRAAHAAGRRTRLHRRQVRRSRQVDGRLGNARRRRNGGHDHAIVELGLRAR